MNDSNIRYNPMNETADIYHRKISTIINGNDRIALVGPNGVGKSTFLKIIEWTIREYTGNVENIWDMTLGYLEQIHFMDEKKTIRDELRDAFLELRNIEKEIEKEEIILSETGEYERYTDLLEQYKVRGWYTYENEIEGVSRGIGIFQLLEKKTSWRLRRGANQDSTCQDSPLPTWFSSPGWTNQFYWPLECRMARTLSHQYLERWIYHCVSWSWISGWNVQQSHGNEVKRRCYILSWWLLILSRGKNQASWERNKIYEEQQTMIETEKTLINRFRAGSRASFAKSRERALEKIEIIDKPETRKWVSFLFPYDKHGPETIIKIEDAFIWRQDPLFFIRWVNIDKKDRVWIVWENWVGKSTLMKTIIKEISPLEWYVHTHENAKILYFSQLHERLNTDKSIYDNFHLHGLEYTRERVGWIIGLYGFDYHDTDKKVSSLSGWERSRLLFALLGQYESNILIFDEPTNHLDYETRESLEKALREYPWAVLFISHDRYFVNKIALKLWVIVNQDLIVSYGNYDDYKYKRDHGIELDMSLFDADGELDLVLEDKLWSNEHEESKKNSQEKREGNSFSFWYK